MQLKDTVITGSLRVTGSIYADSILGNHLTTGGLQLLGDGSSLGGVLVITEDMVTVTTTETKGVSPYNTGYGYTNITVNNISEDVLYQGLLIVPVIVSKMVVASDYRNIRIRFGEDGSWIPVMNTTNGILIGNSYFVKSQNRIYRYSTAYISTGAIHQITDSNATYSPVGLGFGKTVCSTAKDTLAKVAALASYTLVNNGSVIITFDNAVPANSTLNINTKGAQPLYYNGAAITDGIIGPGDTVIVTYQNSKYYNVTLLGVTNNECYLTIDDLNQVGGIDPMDPQNNFKNIYEFSLYRYRDRSDKPMKLKVQENKVVENTMTDFLLNWVASGKQVICLNNKGGCLDDIYLLSSSSFTFYMRSRYPAWYWELTCTKSSDGTWSFDDGAVL